MIFRWKLPVGVAAELRIIGEHLPVDLGVMGAAVGAVEALRLLLEMCTVEDHTR